MSIERITAPSSLPLSTADYQAQNALADALGISGEMVIPVSGSNVVQGAVFNIGGVIYKATSDTAITGTSSPYVKITASGAFATATFVSNLSGVTWNKAYNGYYSGSDLIVFDEGLAITLGAISSANSIDGLFNAAVILSRLITVDGAGSGLDADKIDGIESDRIIYGDISTTKSKLLTGDLNNAKASGFYHCSAISNAPSSGYYHVLIISGPDTSWVRQIAFGLGAGVESQVDIYERAFALNTTWSSWRKIWTEGNDGAGSGLDADLLDGQHGAFYQDAGNLNAGTIPAARLSAADILSKILTVDGAGSGLEADTVPGYGIGVIVPVSISDMNSALKTGVYYTPSNPSNRPVDGYFILHVLSYSADWKKQIAHTINAGGEGYRIFERSYGFGTTWTSWREIWTSGSDGAGSGLDADLLDGLQTAAAATASTVMTRDAAGRSKVVDPSASDDIATKGYVGSLTRYQATTGTTRTEVVDSMDVGDTLQISYKFGNLTGSLQNVTLNLPATGTYRYGLSRIVMPGATNNALMAADAVAAGTTLVNQQIGNADSLIVVGWVHRLT